FLKFSIEMISRHFDSAIARNMVPPFDTKTVAATVMHTVLGAIGVTVQQYMGRPVPYDAMALVANLERLVLQAVGVVAGSES
ncbi:MAG: hypothetical protein LIP77_04170, partial [Planctomycetes bacterium]|nr:hypothetical protein [Planctomycetota bacterium]